MAESSFTRRALLGLLAASLAAGGAGSATAQTVTERLLDRLRQAGFTKIEMRRTFLGRVRIQASHPDGTERELVLNPRTGEVLRDYWERDEDDLDENDEEEDEIEEDAQEDDDDDEDDEDNDSDDDDDDDENDDQDND